MAAITISALATALNDNAANVATQASVTTANITALAALLTLLGTRHGDLTPLLLLLSDTNKAQLNP